MSPTAFQSLDPAGLGVNQAMLKYFALFPTGNDQTTGDGLNTIGFRFNAPIQTNNNLYTTRLDTKLTNDGRHTLFFRGTLSDISVDTVAASFPVQNPSSRLLNNSRGIALGYTTLISQNTINVFRYGLTQQRIENTGVKGDRFRFLGATGSITDFAPTSRANGRKIPVNQFSDDVTLVRGSHTLSFGGILQLTRNNRFTDLNSYPEYTISQTACGGLCRDMFTALNNDADPNNNPSNVNAFVDGILLLTGSITQATATFQVDLQTNTFLPAGSSQSRHFAENNYEVYIQDSWRFRPNITINYGLRYSYSSPVREVNGAIVRPNFDVQTYWKTWQQKMDAGQPADSNQIIQYNLEPSGRFYEPDNNNFAPRAAIAYSPDFKNGLGKLIFGSNGQSAVRFGAGMYYNRIGGALAAITDQFGSPGLATSLVSANSKFNLTNAPRFSGSCSESGCSGLRTLNQFITSPTSASFPVTFPNTASALGFLVDNKLKTPYSVNVLFSFQRELPGKFVIDTGYVGTFGRKLLVLQDYAQFYGQLRDPASGQTFWQAQNLIAGLIGNNPSSPLINPNNAAAVATITSIPFFENLMSNLPNFLNRPTLTPTQAFYVFAVSQAPNWARMMLPLDTGLTGGNSPWNAAIDPERNGFVLSQPQFRNLPGWANLGSSSYHSWQFTLRRNISNGMIGFNYVLSKSMDNASTPENITGRATGQIGNSFDPNAERTVSDFDIRHNFNAHYVISLPFGKGQKFLSDGNGIGDKIARTFLGGIQLTGIARYHSGMPFSPQNGAPRAVNVQLSGSATVNGNFERDLTKNDPNGFPNLFSDPASAFKALIPSLPGSVGSRNSIYGPTYFTMDLGLNKRFDLPWSEKQKVEFRVTAFNAFNKANFYAEPFNNLTGLFSTVQNFGRLTQTAGARSGARELEFGLRFEF